MKYTANVAREYALLASTAGGAMLMARLLSFENWVLAGVNAFLAVYGLRIGVMTARLTGRRAYMSSGFLFSAAAAVLVLYHARVWGESAGIALAATAFVLMVSSVGLSVAGRRQEPGNPLEPQKGADHPSV